MRRAARRDGTEPAIIQALIDAGASVTAISDDNVWDLAVYFRGAWHMLEVKNRRGKLRKNQNWNETIEPGAVKVARTIEEALQAIGAIE